MFLYNSSDLPCEDCRLIAKHRNLSPYHVLRFQRADMSGWQQWLTEARAWKKTLHAPAVYLDQAA